MTHMQNSYRGPHRYDDPAELDRVWKESVRMTARVVGIASVVIGASLLGNYVTTRAAERPAVARPPEYLTDVRRQLETRDPLFKTPAYLTQPYAPTATRK